MAYNVGASGGRSRQRYAQYLPNIAPYEFIEDVSEAQSEIANAESEADAARLRIRHHNRLRITPDLNSLPSVIAVADGLPMSGSQAAIEDYSLEQANDKVLKFPSELMEELIDDGTFEHYTDAPLRRSFVLKAIEQLHAEGEVGSAIDLQMALDKSDWADDMALGAVIESSPDDVRTLEISYTGLEDVDADDDPYTNWRKGMQNGPTQGERGIEALKFAESTGLPLGVSGDGLSYDHQKTLDAQAVLNSLRLPTDSDDDDDGDYDDDDD